MASGHSFKLVPVAGHCLAPCRCSPISCRASVHPDLFVLIPFFIQLQVSSSSLIFFEYIVTRLCYGRTFVPQIRLFWGSFVQFHLLLRNPPRRLAQLLEMCSPPSPCLEPQLAQGAAIPSPLALLHHHAVRLPVTRLVPSTLLSVE